MTGDYYNWWYPEVNVSFYLNGTFEGNSGWYHSLSLGGEVDWGYTPTLQTYGPGQYYQSSAHDAFTPYCSYGGANTFSAMCDLYGGCGYPPPWNSSASIAITRPTRPDYGSAGHPVFFLGNGVSFDNGYSNSTPLLAGSANGAPETPQWIFAAGSTFGNLSCTSCTEPVFTTTKESTGCLDYNVVLNTSYSGFLSDPFYMFINAPNNMVAATCPVNLGCAPNTWNWTWANGNGYSSWVFYTTDTLCATDGPMSNYDMNEAFGTWTKDPSQPTVSWSPPSPNHWGGLRPPCGLT